MREPSKTRRLSRRSGDEDCAEEEPLQPASIVDVDTIASMFLAEWLDDITIDHGAVLTSRRFTMVGESS